jgi:hypothetical protein
MDQPRAIDAAIDDLRGYLIDPRRSQWPSYMCDFVIRESEYPRVPDFLLAEVDGLPTRPSIRGLTKLSGVYPASLRQHLHDSW